MWEATGKVHYFVADFESPARGVHRPSDLRSPTTATPDRRNPCKPCSRGLCNRKIYVDVPDDLEPIVRAGEPVDAW